MSAPTAKRRPTADVCPPPAHLQRGSLLPSGVSDFWMSAIGVHAIVGSPRERAGTPKG